MTDDRRVFEERWTVVRADGLQQARESIAAGAWPELRPAGGEPLVVAGGLIGLPESHVLQLTAFDSAAAWEAAQARRSGTADPAVEHQRARLLRRVGPRPGPVIPDEHRMPFYGYRRWHIDPGDLDEIIRMSEDVIWPRMEWQGARVLGLWAQIAPAMPLEIVALTGYNGAGHWWATREAAGRPAGMPADLWERSRAARGRRTRMMRRTWVHLMRAFEFGPAPG